jgi:molybdopterin-guanine dinucleotide biosynthesis protein A
MHKKHADLQRPLLGHFARHELAILGSTCENISAWATLIAKALVPHNVVYADANHNPAPQSDFISSWKDNQYATVLGLSNQSAMVDRHIALSQTDLIIVNGNHFEATHQIIICDSDKEASLRKRASQLTNVIAIITTDHCASVPDYVKELIPYWTDIRVFHERAIDQLISLLKQQLLKPAPIKALVMAGGKSVRMGKDKTHIPYHGKPQFAHVYELCASIGIEAYVSCRAEQSDYYNDKGYRTISDRLLNMGPLAGIASAFMTDPNSAWLVLACDVPFIDRETIEELITNRAPMRTATAFQSPFDRFPEPLIALWEPKAYPMIMSFIALGHSCPRKVLINTAAHVILASHPEKLENINTPDDLADAMQQLSGS